MKTYLIILVFILGLMLFYNPLKAQHQIEINFFPGYHLINSDHPSSDRDKTNWVFGGSASFRTQVWEYPIAFSLGYTQGQSMVHQYESNTDILGPDYKVHLRYQTIPIEAFYIHTLNRNTEVLAGINFTPQYRTLLYENINIDNDRLLSFGVGLSGEIKTDFVSFDSGRKVLFGSLAARWTEFLFHHANGRDMDDFNLRHVALAPQIGFSWNLN